MVMPERDKVLERNNKNKVLRLVAQRIKKYGYLKTKPTIFTRVRGPVIEFLHLHKFTFEASFRAHLGIRVINETRAAVGLNGPSSDEIAVEGTNQRKYNFPYSESVESLDHCADLIMEFVEIFAEPWFEKWREPAKLISDAESPLHPQAKVTLLDALTGNCSVSNAAIMRQHFNAP